MPRRIVIGALGLLAGGCGGPALGPSDVAGLYQATAFTVTATGARTDVLAQGGSVNLRLEGDGTTSGRLVMPAIPGFRLEPTDDDLAGRYVLGKSVLRLLPTAEGSFLDGVFFTSDPPELRAAIIFGVGGTGNVTLVLRRQ